MGRVYDGAHMGFTLIRDPRCKISASCSVLAHSLGAYLKKYESNYRVKAVVQNIALTFVCLDSTKKIPLFAKERKLLFSLSL